MSRNPPRISVYVDGWNLYHGLRHADMRQYLWLDLVALCHWIARRKGYPDASISVNYYTAPSAYPDSAPRQAIYLDALDFSGVRITKGRFQRNDFRCRECKAKRILPLCPQCGSELPPKYEEKQTDVRLALDLALETGQRSPDRVWLLSGDADMTPAVEFLERLAVPFMVIFPPKRVAKEIVNLVGAARTWNLKEQELLECQFPEALTTVTRTIRRPRDWPPILGEQALFSDEELGDVEGSQ